MGQLAFCLYSSNVVKWFDNARSSRIFWQLMSPHQKAAGFPVPFSRIHHWTYGVFKEETLLQDLLEAGCLPVLEIGRYYCWAEEAPGCWPLTAKDWHILSSNQQQMGHAAAGPLSRCLEALLQCAEKFEQGRAERSVLGLQTHGQAVEEGTSALVLLPFTPSFPRDGP